MRFCVLFGTTNDTSSPNRLGSGAIDGDIARIAAVVEVEGSVADPAADTADIHAGVALVAADSEVAGVTRVLRLDTRSGITGDTADAEVSAVALGRT